MKVLKFEKVKLNTKQIVSFDVLKLNFLFNSYSKSHFNQVKTVKFTGKIPVDEQCIEAIGNDYHIYIENGVAFDCMLNQVCFLT